MQFTTPVPSDSISKKITHNSLVFSTGSCFAESMSRKLEYFQFKNISNPFGILFHPLALLHLFELADAETNNSFDLFQLNEKWHYFGAHSRLSSADKFQLETSLQNALKNTKLALKCATHFIVTLGTAWVFREIETGKVVANCHKVPQQKFEKVLLSPDEILESLRKLSQIISKHNPDATQIFTVSPVRHIKDGMVGNQRSKANLVSGLHSFLEASEKSGIFYFPSYEIVLDELRDYRFFSADMLHPSDIAIEYIWNRFSQSIMQAETLEIMNKVSFIRKALEHRPFDPDSAATLQHSDRINQKILELKLLFPHMKF